MRDPFVFESMNELVEGIMKQDMQPILREIPEEIKNLVEQMLKKVCPRKYICMKFFFFFFFTFGG
jgi:hypothetical protein